MSINSYNKRAKKISILLLILFCWFLLSFLNGVENLVTPWRIKHGFWFWASLSLILQILVASFVCWRGIKWSHYFVLGLTGSWLSIQFIAHWQKFLFPSDDLSSIIKYYDHYDTWFLIPKQIDRIVPDGYHIILSILLLIIFTYNLRMIWKNK